MNSNWYSSHQIQFIESQNDNKEFEMHSIRNQTQKQIFKNKTMILPMEAVILTRILYPLWEPF